MLGNPGSNPLELFWDLVDGLDQKLDAKLAVAESAINKHNERLLGAGDKSVDQQDESGSSKGFKVTPTTTKAELLAIIRADTSEAVQKLSRDDLEEIYQSVSYMLWSALIL